MIDRSPKQEEEYLAMGFELLPSGRINHHLWYGRKYGLGSVKDSTWSREKKLHTCCKSKRAYCHRIGCINRKETGDKDDYSDLKDID